MYNNYSLKGLDLSLSSVYNDSVRVFRMIYLVFPNMGERTTIWSQPLLFQQMALNTNECTRSSSSPL